MTYRTLDGIFLTGETPEALEASLRQHAWMTEASQGEYRMAVARRIALWNDTPIRTDTAQHFLDDLIQAGFLISED